jgi:hypothetical protein
MKASKWLLLVVALLALVPLAADSGNVLQPRNSLMVYDSKNKLVGTVIDINSFGPTVVMRAGPLTIPLVVYPNRFGYSGVLMFGTSDCTGTPYFPTNGPPSLVANSFVTNDGTLYVAAGNIPASTVNIGSLVQDGDNFPGAPLCNAGDYGDVLVVEAQAVENLNQKYQPPFVLK